MKVQLDEQGYFTGNYAVIGDVPNSTQVETLPPDQQDSVKVKSYKLENGVWVFNENKYNELLTEFNNNQEQQVKQMKIAQLQQQLNDTDYKIIKCQEYSLAGLELPYNIEELHTQRQAIRDQINELQQN